MAFSYSGISNYGKVTLPSVEAGLGSLNILRDPPKSIMTRRIDKVGETSSITQMIDESGNRACEAIAVYPRGQNPFAKVSYQNYGYNSGQQAGGMITGGGRQAYLPYNLGGGQFRPPVLLQEQLLPLSRLPRNNTSAFTKPGINQFVNTGKCPDIGDPYKGVKSDVLQGCVKPTATYVVGTPLVEPFEVKYVIKKSPISVKANSGVRTRDLTTLKVQKPTKSIIEAPTHIEATVNVGSNNIRINGENNVNTEKYIQDTLHADVGTNKSSHIQISSIEDIMDVDIRTKDLLKKSYTTQKTGYTKEGFMSTDIHLNKNPVHASARANTGSNIYVRQQAENSYNFRQNRPTPSMMINQGYAHGVDNLSSREYYLPPKPKLGQFEGKTSIPMTERMQNVNENYRNDKSIMNQRILQQTLGRNQHLH